MDTFAALAGTFAVAALASAVLTGLWIRLARARRIVDLPGQRRLHVSTTPRGGGIGIGLVMVVTCVLVIPGTPGPASWPGLAAAIAVFSAIGLLDDLRPMPAWLKLLLQLAAAAFMLAVLGQPGMFVWLLGMTLVAAYFINVWNFMDGSNGLVAGQSLLIALAVSVWPGVPLPTRFAALALAGACTGFLPFNLPRAQVFLGDVGSHALGASVFALLWLAWKQGALSLPQVLLLSSAMLLDSGLTLLRRALGGRKVWHAHREHLYQYAVRSGHSHARVCLAYATWTTIAAGVACLTGAWRSSSQAWLLLIVMVIGGLVYNGLRGYWLGFGTRRQRTRKHG
jgi:UDP-N-acetylmuramyl pentapeptide phosphotransferase/UDP-N-acetylglucosamine-1-phosphate transferase